MIKKILLIIMISVVSFASSYAVTPADEPQLLPQTFSSEEIAAFEKRFKEIDVHMNYLKDKMVEHNDLISMYTDSEKYFRELKTSPDIRDIRLSRMYMNTKLDTLEEKAKQKVSYIKRMDFMYKIMVIMGMGIIVFMIFYSTYMYVRRK